MIELYEDIRPYIGDGDLILWRGTGLVSRLIQLLQYHNHASLAFNFEKHGAKRVILYEALYNGIEPEFFSARLSDYGYGRCWWFKLRREYDHLRPEFYRCANEFAGVHYDYTSLFKNLLGYVSVDVDRLFCSEFAYVSGKNAGLPGNLKKAPRPDDLIELLDWWADPVEVIWKHRPPPEDVIQIGGP